MVMRVGGLASGMDIDALVAKLMSAERAPLYKMQQKKTSFEWQRDAYRGVNTTMKAFDKYLFDNFKLSSNFVKKSTTITGANTDKVSITAGTNASGSLNIQGVDSLATAATSGAKTAQQTTYRNATSTDKLVDIGIATGEINFTIDGNSEKVIINADTTVENLVEQLVDKGFDKASFNEQTGRFSLGSTEGKKIEVDDANSAAFLRDELGFATTYVSTGIKLEDPNDPTKEVFAKSTTKLSELGLTGSSLTFKVDGVDKTVNYDVNDPDQTIGTLVEALKAEGLTASFSGSTGKLSVSSKDGKPLQIDAGNSGDLAKLGLHQTTGGLSKGFNQVEIAVHGGSPNTPAKDTTLQHLGLLEDGKFKLSAVQADGKMKDTIIDYKATDTIDSLIKKINSSGAGVTAMYSNGQMSISANNTGTNKDGATADIQLSTVKTVDKDGNDVHDESGLKLFEQFGFTTTGGTVGASGETKVDLSGLGSNAKYKVNDLEMESQSNTINIEGYTITLKDTFTEAEGGPSVSSTNDTDAMSTKIKEFVTTYNALVTSLNGSLKETKYKGYSPLTTEQKEEMSENEIKLWEEKAKSGLLRNDSLVREGMSKLRADFISPVGGLSDSMIDSLAEIGITTSKDYTDGGTLVIDENKLRAALEKDSEQVANIFIKQGSAKETVTDPNTGIAKTVDTRGIVDRLRDSIKSFELKIEKKAGRSTMLDNQYNIGKSMVDLDTRIERLQKRLVSVESRYWKQFTIMEQAINKANSQSNMFMQQ